MHQNSQVIMTLAVAHQSSDLSVISVNGHDRLNAPFCFDIDLVSPDPDLDCQTLLLRDAWLQMGVQGPHLYGLNGQIQKAKQLHRGPDLSLYRLRLMPALQRLCGPARRRSYNGLTVLQIITHLLRGHGLGDDTYRFDRLVGVYPPREHCLQYDESDLHFLQRLCEEEGIGFRHEHRQRQHVLVFSDDPASFPEWPGPAPIDHLTEHWSVRTSYSTHAGEHYTPQTFAPARHPSDADNQSLETSDANRQRPGFREQSRGRLLERLRCERREIVGSSRLPWLRSGRVMCVDGLSDAALNDQWLLTDIRHSAWQLAPLRSCTSADVIQILQAIALEGAPDAGLARLLRPLPGSDRLALEGYENNFQVLPWTMPFRPALEHSRPVIAETDTARLMDEQPDASGRLRIRYAWQSDADDPVARDSWARVVGQAGPLTAGALLRIKFFEGDPDQPAVYGVINDAPDSQGLAENQRFLGAPLPGSTQDTAESLHIESARPIVLRGPRATLHIGHHGIQYTPLATQDDAV